MTKKTYKKVDSKGRQEEWSWEETPETTAAMKKLWKNIAELELKAPDYGVGK
jgi:hypothetical protein